MSDRALRIAVAVLSLGGAAVATFILAARWRGIELACSTGGCETVQNSSYAELLGVPVALLGLGAYLLIGATALTTDSRGLLVGAGLALGAVLFSAYLLVVQLAVVHAVCDWCLVNDAIVTLVAIAAVLRLRRPLLERQTVSL